MESKTVISVCETQPITVMGLQYLCSTTDDLHFGATYQGIPEWVATPDAQNEILLVDKGYGLQTILDGLAHLDGLGQSPSLVVWGGSLTESEALRYLQAGAKGILRRTAGATTILACLRSVAAGQSWIQNSLFRDAPLTATQPHSELTPRELQVLKLVEQGRKNKEIAEELGIRPGTVKIHLKHVFEKTGIRERHSLALNGLRKKGIISPLIADGNCDKVRNG